MNDVSVLVGIVTRNRAGVLPKAITSALAQSVTNLQVAVIDDGSTDGTMQMRENFPQVRWIRRDISQGYMSARNEFMMNGDFDYFVSLDDDAWFVKNDEIALAVSYLEAEANVGAVAFDILSPDRAQPVTRSAPQRSAMFIGCGHVLRLSAVRRAGGYEMAPGSYGGEEKDLCLRLMDAGYEIAHLPGVHVWHDKTPLAREISAQHRSGVCNDLVMTLRRTPLMLLPLALPAKCLRHWRFARRSELTRSCLEGFSLFLRSVPFVLRTRRPVKRGTLREFMRLSRN